jgi:hypothetical protein
VPYLHHGIERIVRNQPSSVLQTEPLKRTLGRRRRDATMARETDAQDGKTEGIFSRNFGKTVELKFEKRIVGSSTGSECLDTVEGSVSS